MGRFAGEASAALVFLIAYIAIFCWMTYAYQTKKIKWRSRYSFLYFHVIIRIASQACGVAFGVLGFTNIDVFLAYLILGAEGYFTLVLCAYRFLISWHQHNLPSHESWLEPRETDTSSKGRWRRFFIFLLLGPLAVLMYWRNPMVIIHSFLIIANTAIITGGSYLAGADPEKHNYQNKLRVSKITRTAGQSIFLAINSLLIVFIIATIRGERKRGAKKTHGTLLLLAIAWIPLITRGIFGLLQASVYDLSYYNPENYSGHGMTPRFLLIEYILGVLTEWVACLILNLTWYTSRNDPKKGEVKHLSEKTKIQDGVEGAR